MRALRRIGLATIDVKRRHRTRTCSRPDLSHRTDTGPRAVLTCSVQCSEVGRPALDLRDRPDQVLRNCLADPDRSVLRRPGVSDRVSGTSEGRGCVNTAGVACPAPSPVLTPRRITPRRRRVCSVGRTLLGPSTCARLEKTGSRHLERAGQLMIVAYGTGKSLRGTDPSLRVTPRRLDRRGVILLAQRISGQGLGRAADDSVIEWDFHPHWCPRS